MSTRIVGYDFARSLALFGLVVVNFIPDVEVRDLGLHHVMQVQLRSLTQGGSIATFLVLAGVGVSLLTQQILITNEVHGITDSRKRLIRRAALLLLAGICCNVIWQTAFLGLYSIYVVFGALLLMLSSRWLWTLISVSVIISFAFIFLIYDYFDFFEIIQSSETLQDSNLWTVDGMIYRLSLSGLDSRFFWGRFSANWNVVGTPGYVLPQSGENYVLHRHWRCCYELCVMGAGVWCTVVAAWFLSISTRLERRNYVDTNEVT